MLNKIAHVNGVFPFFTAKPGPCVAVRRNARINRYFHEILALSGVSRSRGNLPKTEGVQRDHFSSLVGITAHATRDVSALMMRSPALRRALRVSSRMRPKTLRCSATSLRMSVEFSPIPPVNTTPSGDAATPRVRRYAVQCGAQRFYRQLRPRISLAPLFQRPEIGGNPGDPQQARFFVNHTLQILERLAGLLGNPRHRAKIHVTTARAHHQPFQRRHPHRGIDAFAITNRANRRAITRGQSLTRCRPAKARSVCACPAT